MESPKHCLADVKFVEFLEKGNLHPKICLCLRAQILRLQNQDVPKTACRMCPHSHILSQNCLQDGSSLTYSGGEGALQPRNSPPNPVDNDAYEKAKVESGVQ